MKQKKSVWFEAESLGIIRQYQLEHGLRTEAAAINQLIINSTHKLHPQVTQGDSNMTTKLSLDVFECLETIKAETGKSFDDLVEEALRAFYMSSDAKKEDKLESILDFMKRTDERLSRLEVLGANLKSEATVYLDVLGDNLETMGDNLETMGGVMEPAKAPKQETSTKKPKQSKVDRELAELQQQLAARQQMPTSATEPEPEEKLEPTATEPDAIAATVEQPVEPLETPRTLTKEQLAERLGAKASGGAKSAMTALGTVKKFKQWTADKDPEGLAWQPVDESRAVWIQM